MPIKLNVRVVHVAAFQYRKNTCERLRSLLEKDSRFAVKFDYIIEHDPHEITQEEVRTFVNYEQIKEEEFKHFNASLKNLHVNHLSNSLKHRKAIELSAASGDDEFNIILEDDIVFNDNVVDALYQVITTLPDEWDIMFLGLPSSKGSEGKKYQKLEEVFPMLPCCDSYMFRNTTAKKLLESFAPIKFTNNIQLSYLMAKLALRAHLAIPNTFIDGSKLGLYFSSLEANNRLIFNQDYINLANQINEKTQFTDEEKKQIHQSFQQVKLKTNPEFYYLKAVYENKVGNHVFAKAIFDYTFDLYENNGTMMNNQSTFLRDYLRVFKHLQEV
jgi:GR25 family glycosyltransferase involved in LPS biosynthesis